MPECRDGQDCPLGVEGELARLRGDIDAKHQDNRRDIHRLRNEVQKSVLEFTTLSGKVAPLLDNGQPGVITRMSEKLDELLDQMTEVRITQGRDDGRRGEADWMRGIVAAIIVGVILAVVQHFWK